MQRKAKIVKKRTTISIAVPIHLLGLKLAALERRDFSGMLENAIEERWNAKHHKEAKAA